MNSLRADLSIAFPIVLNPERALKKFSFSPIKRYSSSEKTVNENVPLSSVNVSSIIFSFLSSNLTTLFPSIEKLV
jgi:hypothetical protein